MGGAVARRVLTTYGSVVCNRFTVKHADRVDLWSKEWLFVDYVNFVARYNISPTERIKVVTRTEGKNHAEDMKWGITGFNGQPLLNARADKLRSAHKTRAQERRCVIPADGFYEWRKAGKERVPFHFQLKGEEPFAFAGIYSSEGACAIVTTTANALIAPIHDRLPVMLGGEAARRWIEPGPISEGELARFCTPMAAEAMECFEVSRYVSRAGNEGPECLHRANTRIAAVEKPSGEQLNLL